MNHQSTSTALVAMDSMQADFTQSAITHEGYPVVRYPSIEECLEDLQRQLPHPEHPQSAPAFPIAMAVIAGPLPLVAETRQAAALQNLAPGLPVVVIGSQGTIPAAVSLMKQGAQDVMNLPITPEQLRSQLRVAMHLAVASIQKCAYLTQLRSRLKLLTPAELEVLKAILNGKANKEIAHALEIGLRTAELRRSKIMKKMQARSLAELVKFVCQARQLQVPAGPPNLQLC